MHATWKVLFPPTVVDDVAVITAFSSTTQFGPNDNVASWDTEMVARGCTIHPEESVMLPERFESDETKQSSPTVREACCFGERGFGVDGLVLDG